MKITKKHNSNFLTISKSEIKDIIDRAVLSKGNAKFLLKIAQTTPMANEEIDQLEQWLNALVKKIWRYNQTIDAENNKGMQFINKNIPEFKPILPLLQEMQKQLNTSVNGFVDQVNAVEPDTTHYPAGSSVVPAESAATGTATPAAKAKGTTPKARTPLPETATGTPKAKAPGTTPKISKEMQKYVDLYSDQVRRNKIKIDAVPQTYQSFVDKNIKSEKNIDFYARFYTKAVRERTMKFKKVPKEYQAIVKRNIDALATAKSQLPHD